MKLVASEADARVDQKRKLSYDRWRRKMELLRSEFQLCASRVSVASKDIRVQVRPYELIDKTSWENLSSGIGTARTSLFVIDFSRKGSLWRYYFFFGKHYWSELDDEQERSEDRVCLLVSEARGHDEAKPLYQMDSCPLGLHEVFVVENRFVRKRPDPETGNLVYDRDIPALQIAQDFIEKVVLHRLT